MSDEHVDFKLHAEWKEWRAGYENADEASLAAFLEADRSRLAWNSCVEEIGKLQRENERLHSAVRWLGWALAAALVGVLAILASGCASPDARLGPDLVSAKMLRSYLSNVDAQIYGDARYLVPTRAWVRQTWEFSARFRAGGRKDCDDVAREFHVAAVRAWARTVQVRSVSKNTGIAVGTAGITLPDGRRHAVNLVWADDGVWFFDPQTGEFDPVRADAILWCVF